MSEIRKVLLAAVAYAGINLAVTFLLRKRDKRTEELEGALREGAKEIEELMLPVGRTGPGEFEVNREKFYQLTAAIARKLRATEGGGE